MGGTPSYPHSLCLDTVYGKDVDVMVWDYRMVESDPWLSELYLRQAILMEGQPVVMFKRVDSIKKLVEYYAPASVHVVDETEVINHLKRQHPQNLSKLSDKNDFCDQARAKERLGSNFTEGECQCPGQVKWHSGWQLHRVRGAQMAHLYLRVLEKAVKKVGEILDKASP
jgi:hypothetical protein